ncbi:MAG: hypothetical protein IPL22_02670 [Bacteroidetes bacterium]|nr:hypothetical protein [Bacteroidota bacterium]
MKKLNSNNKTITNAPSTGRGIKRLTMAVLLLLVSNWVTAQTTFNNDQVRIGTTFAGNGWTDPSNITGFRDMGVMTTFKVRHRFLIQILMILHLLVQYPLGTNILQMSDSGGILILHAGFNWHGRRNSLMSAMG